MTIIPAYFPLAGGWNNESPPLATGPGEVLDATNYECLSGGGYRRILGYALYDGQTTASLAVPGSGPIKLVHIYKQELYAIREDGANGRLYKATTSGWAEVDNAYTWSLGGTYRALTYNFFGQDDQEQLFIVNGVDPCAIYNGTTLASNPTGASVDAPKCVAGFANSLVLGIESSLIGSGIAGPTDWGGGTFAFEIAVGDTVTDLMAGPNALVIGCENKTMILQGTNVGDFQLNEMTKIGPYPATMANIGGQIIGLDQQGVMSLSASQAYGNFAYNLISQKIAEYMKTFGQGALAIVNRASSQYRLYNGSTGIYFTFAGTQLVGAMRVVYDHDVTAACEGLFPTNEPVSFFGSDDGNVYQLETGTSFAGNPVYSYLVTSFHHHGSPSQYKRFRAVIPDLSVDGDEVTLNIAGTTDYGKGLISRGTSGALGQTQGALWDFVTWDEFYWDSYYHHDAKIRLSLVGKNLSILISSNSSTDSVHTIYGITVHYSARRLVR